MRIRFLYPEGKKRALTMSYDDGALHDERLVEIFNRYGIKGTFHLNSACVNRNNDFTPEALRKRYAGHEIASHTINHEFIDQIPKEQLIEELLEDRRTLESVTGQPVRGFSYPCGINSETITSALKACGFAYARTVNDTHDFQLPRDFLRWNGSFHHNSGIIEQIDRFGHLYYQNPLFYVWGHSHEFARQNNWDLMEEFCDKVTSTLDDVWYATNIEIYDYITAFGRLIFTADRTSVINPSSCSVWITADGEPIELKPGLTKLA